jgi:DNA-directed RNA polymerase specialized sigma24 family protein
VKAWLARAAANTVLRGEHPRNRFARWSRWFPGAPTVDESRFQGGGEPHPGHWRRFPRAWPPIRPDDPAVQEALATAMDELPRPWRDVVIARDLQDRTAAEVRDRQDLTVAQQRAMLNRARASLRQRLAERFAGDDG